MKCYYCNGNHEDDPCPVRVTDAERFAMSSPYKDKETYYLSPRGNKRKAYTCRFSRKLYIEKHKIVSSVYIDTEIANKFIQDHPSSYFIEGLPNGIGRVFHIVDPVTGRYADVTDYNSW